MTMNISHHPDPAWLVSYSAGALPDPFNVVLRAHLAVCRHCQDNLLAADEIGAAFMFGATHTPEAAPQALVNPLPSLAGGECPVEWLQDDPSDISRFFDSYIGGHLDSLNWMRVGKGLRVCRLSNDKTNRMWMLRAEPGTVLPRHSHDGSELTLILKGAFRSQGNTYRVGDIDDADDSVLHQPVVTEDEECICIAALDGPLRFSSLLPRLAQPFVGL